VMKRIPNKFKEYTKTIIITPNKGRCKSICPV